MLDAEGIGDTLALITWVVFGTVVIGRSFEALSWEVVLYAVPSLTVVRMLPVFLSLSGMNLGSGEKLFMGWFGPRGLATIVFAVMVLNDKLPGGDTIVMTAACAIVLSVVLHGLSAKPLIAALVAKIKRSDGAPAAGPPVVGFCTPQWRKQCAAVGVGNSGPVLPVTQCAFCCVDSCAALWIKALLCLFQTLITPAGKMRVTGRCTLCQPRSNSCNVQCIEWLYMMPLFASLLFTIWPGKCSIIKRCKSW